MTARLLALRRPALVLSAVLALMGPLAGCGAVTRLAGAAGTVAPTGQGQPGMGQRACADLAQLRHAVTDLETANDQRDLSAGQRAWTDLRQSLEDLTAALDEAASSAGIGLTDVLGPVVDAVGDMDSMGKLTAVATAVKAAGPAVAAASHARSVLSCD